VPAAALLDVDGTLVDSVYHHTMTWQRAFQRLEIGVPAWRCHRHIGMGGEKIVAALAGEEAEQAHGEELRETEKRLFNELIEEIRPLPGAPELVEALAGRGLEVYLASSGSEEHIEHLIGALGIGETISGFTTSADVEATKPDPDLIETALKRTGSDDAVLLGDSTWDVKAAQRAGIETVGLLCGGFCESELREAGAGAVYEDPADLLAKIDDSPFAG
jgi:HAD superfamily hydrolase (TIGR01549 family)